MNHPTHVEHQAQRRRWLRTAIGLTATGVLMLTGATAGFAAAADATHQATYGPAIKLVAINPQASDTAGADGDFTVDLQTRALNALGTANCRRHTDTGPG